MQSVLAPLVALLLLAGARSAQVLSGSEDVFVLNFSAEPHEQLKLDNFVRMLGEATGQKFTWEDGTAEALASTPIVLPKNVRVPKKGFLEFARFQLFLRGFGCFEVETGRWAIRPVPPALVRLAWPPHVAVLGIEERGHVEVFVPPTGEQGPSGVIVNQPKVAPGVLLTTGPGKNEATLLDRQGQTLRSWNAPEGSQGSWDSVTLLRDGGLVCVDSEQEALLRFGPDGRVRWQLALAVHHPASELPDGRILVLTRRARLVPALDPVRRTVDHLVTLVSAEGQVLAEHSLLDLLQAEGSGVALQRPRLLDELPAEYEFDLLHASSLFRIDDAQVVSEESPFQPGRLLVTFRNLDRVALFDLALRRCVWSFGLGRLRNPHDAQLLADGTMLVLDGFDANGGARVIALDPVNERVEWEYRAARHGGTPCSGQGSLAPQADGNVLVGLADEAFEVTRKGALVWRYRNPPVGMPGRLGTQWVRLDAESSKALAAPAPR